MSMTNTGRLTIGAVAGLLLSAAAWGQSQEQTLVAEMYGERIRQVQSTREIEDDVALAQELLTAAGDQANPKMLRYVLARTALDVAMPMPGLEAAEASRQALELADQLHPLDKLEKATIAQEIAYSQLTHALNRRVSFSIRRELAQEVVEADLALARLAWKQPERLPQAEKAVHRAKNLARSYRLRELIKPTDQAYKELLRRQRRHHRLQLAETALETAEQTGSPAGVEKARRELGGIYLLLDGDVARAATFLKDTDDPRAEAVVTAAAYVAEPDEVDPEAMLASAEVLANLAEDVTGQAQLRLGRLAGRMIRSYLGGETTQIGAAKARLLKVRLDKLLPDPRQEKQARELSESYGGLHGRIEPLDDEQVRVEYDFSDSLQIKDFSPGEGAWDVGKGVLACKTQPYSRGNAMSKLRFRATEPFTLRFKGSAKYELGAYVTFHRPGQAFAQRWAHRFLLGRHGLSHHNPGGQAFRDGRARINKSAVYRFSIAFDGKGKVIWKINGNKVREADTHRLPYDSDDNYITVTLRTESSDNHLTAFDDLVMEGQLLRGDLHRPEESKTGEE